MGITFSTWVRTLACALLAALSTVHAQPAANAASRTLPTVDGNQRLALVIGNAAYRSAPLLNPINDARSMTLALREAGFTVIHHENADQRTMVVALREFGDRLRQGGTGLFYFSGHGMQIKGRNYLVPVDALVEREDEAAYQTLDAQAVLDKMEAAANLANIMILDACRNNPFARNFRANQQGLAQMDAPSGTLVAYATSPGSVASDGYGQGNGLYTRHLLEAMRRPGNKVEDVFKQVRSAVRRESKGVQTPWESTSLEGDFYFFGGPSLKTQSADALPSQQPATSQSLTAEKILWEAVRDSSQPIEVSIYLSRYPEGVFAAAARARIAALTTPSARPGVPPEHRPDPENTAGQAPTLQVSMRPPQKTNKNGFRTGDRWRYQVVDKFKGDVVRNYVSTVDDVLPDGSLRINAGQMQWDAQGNPLHDSSNESEASYSGYLLVPPTLQSGARTPLSYEITRKSNGRFVSKDTGKGSMTVKGREKIKTPAGEFNAWRVEIEIYGSSDGDVNRPASGVLTWRRTMTGWYVPELRSYAAYEEEIRTSTGYQSGSTATFAQRERHELTSYSVSGADDLAQR
jgi:hypothetical protein